MIGLYDIDKHFGDNPVLRQVSLQVAAGSVTALIGPSGSGKSTLLRCVNLLEISERGRLQVGTETLDFQGRPPIRDAVLRVRRQTGMVLQNFQLFAHQTVIGNVMESLVTVLKWPREQAREHAMALLKKVGMAHKAQAWPATLSGGQQQRVAIARALAPSPRVLLCDEPTSALDPALAAEVVDVLKRLADEGMTMIMATHDLRLAANIADQVIFLQAGQVVESGPPRAVFTQARDARTREFVITLTEGLPPEWGQPQ
ncbi:amino acid ABC transporter ATP-binding protein [Bordetella holmesii]|uniref:amino acid ABC transporter ATP-binding protein n=1 Tax=Bordetella holmesii TaxID=35814 RepID=UPI00044DB59D|nr:amino acid ABC transporter ATP-binding protein [Bordetella holmesii]EWM51642.1 ABC transporter family protein [Bordetella holmesii 70147]QGD44143.1 amino acid ABC transporter ATP-binding protein [Bordetella holmesii]